MDTKPSEFGKDDAALSVDSADDEDTVDSDDDIDQPASSKPAASAALPLQERHRLEFLVIIIGASALSFNAGFINGVTYQLHNIPVSHVTGTTTKAGLMVGKSDYEDFAVLLALIVCFVFGSAVTGSLMPHSSFHLGLEYGPLFLLGSALFLAACLLNHFYPEQYYYYYLSAMGSGLQNAMTTRYSGNVIRTTHMTGTATDVGLVLGRMVVGDWKEAWKLCILLPIFAAFFLGGLVSVFAFARLGNLSLLINVVVFFSIGLAYSFLVSLNLNIPLWKAFFGFYETTHHHLRRTRETVAKTVRRLRSRIEKIHLHSPLAPRRHQSPYARHSRPQLPGASTGGAGARRGSRRGRRADAMDDSADSQRAEPPPPPPPVNRGFFAALAAAASPAQPARGAHRRLADSSDDGSDADFV
eukprot:gene5170-3689_t